MASPRVKDSGRKLKRLPGWIAAPVAAERLGLSRQWVFDMINDGRLDAFEIGGTGARPACIIVRESTVTRWIAERAARNGCPQCRVLREGGAEVTECVHQVPAAPAVVEDPELAALLGV
jgi:hypothetical protein